MERRMLLAVLLSFLVVTLYTMATGQCEPPPKAPTTAGSGEESPADAEGGAVAEKPGPRPAALPGEEEPRPAAGAEGEAAPAAPQDPDPQASYEAPTLRTVIESTELEVGFTAQGGAVESVRLRHAFESDHTTPLDLIVPLDPFFLLGQIDDGVTAEGRVVELGPRAGAPGGADRAEDEIGRLRRYQWTRDEAAEAATADLDVVYRCTTANAIWTKRWIVADGEGRFDIRVRVSRQALSSDAASPQAIKVLAASGLLREPATGAAFQYPNVALMRQGQMDQPKEAPAGIEVTSGPDATMLRLLGARSHYFLGTFFTDKDRPDAPKIKRFWATGEAADMREGMMDEVVEFFREVRGRDAVEDEALLERIRTGIDAMHLCWIVTEIPAATDAAAAEAGAVELPFYLGPIDRQVLRNPEYAQVKPVIRYQGAFDLVADALLGIYDFFRNLLGSAGIAVILMTIVVRGLMMPLSIRNQLSMRQYSRKIAKLKPQLDKLKKKFGGNAKKMRDEQAKLYREHGVGLPTGCLMMVVQIPIFFALFSSLRSEYTLRNASFLWINDLGAPDKLIDFGHTIVNLGILTIFSLNILPLLMVGLSLWQQRLMPKPADEQQAQQMRMMKWLPIVFAVILYNYTAALALYMVLSSAVSIVESRIVRAKDPSADDPKPAPPAPASS